jgi:hypothetical protein
VMTTIRSSELGRILDGFANVMLVTAPRIQTVIGTCLQASIIFDESRPLNQ